MTSPKTDHLPHVYPGMIWDGVTEYLDELPPEAPSSLAPPHVRRRVSTLQ